MRKQSKQGDPRFIIAHREALIGVSIVIFNFIWWFGFAYGLGSKPEAEYTYILGFPAWFFYSCIIGFIIVALIVLIVVKFLFVEVKLEDHEEEGKK